MPTTKPTKLGTSKSRNKPEQQAIFFFLLFFFEFVVFLETSESQKTKLKLLNKAHALNPLCTSFGIRRKTRLFDLQGGGFFRPVVPYSIAPFKSILPNFQYF